MSIKCGASCIGRYFWFTDDCKIVEARILQNNEHPHFWEAVDHCIYKKINLIVTIDTYLTGSRWNPSDGELATYTDWLCKEFINSGANKDNCKINYDNEPEEHDNKETYTHKLNIVYGAVKGRFNVIGGNVCADVNYLDFIAKNSKCEYLGVHFQSTTTSANTIDYYGNIYKRIATENNKKLTCTEANWFDLSTLEGYQLLLKQLIKAEAIGCEDFCVAVINQTFGYQNAPDDDSNPWLAFLTDGVPRSQYWNDFIRIINEKKPLEVLDMVELNFVKPGSKNEETRAVQQIMIDEGYDLSPYGADSIYGDITKKAIIKWQTDNGLKIDGVVGRETWQWILANIKTGLLRFVQLIIRIASFK